MKFPIYKNDGIAAEKITDSQLRSIEKLKVKIKSGEYKLIENECLCSNKDKSIDIVIAEKDRYGLPIKSVLCGKCGIIRSSTIFDNDSIIKFYSEEYRDIYTSKDSNGTHVDFYNDQVNRGKFLYSTFSKIVGDKKNLKIFEIGCGAGGILFPFLENDNFCSGSDYDTDYLDYGKKMGLDLKYGDYENILADESTDLIILSHVLEHITNPIQEMNKMIRKVKPNGYLIIEIPGIFIIDKAYFDPILYLQNAHVYSFYKDFLSVFYQALGLKVIYGDERCVFILQKPINWEASAIEQIYSPVLAAYPKKIKKYLRNTYFTYRFKLNPYIWKEKILKLLGK